MPLSFNLYRANPLSSPHADLEIEQQAIIAGLRAAYALLEKNLPGEPLLGGLLDHVRFHGHTQPCGVGENYLVVAHTGQLAQCHMRLDATVDATNSIDLCQPCASGADHQSDRGRQGGLPHLHLPLSVRRRLPIGNLPHHRTLGPCESHCTIYRALMPDVLRLEGLRLMKTHGYLH